ncbi:MAG: ATP-binding protein [Sphingobacteriia bacterium]|nr:ATP-binding protein [Sphingobacteriia bacterium]
MSNKSRISFLKEALALISAFIFCVLTVSAQNFNSYVYNSENGLPTDLVKSVAVAPGFGVMIGTDKGLIVHDGQEFKPFAYPDMSQYVKSIFRSSKGRILVSDDMGLSELVPSQKGYSLNLLGKGLVNWSNQSLWYPKLLFEDTKGSLFLTDNSSLWLVTDSLRKVVDFAPGQQASDNIQRSYLLADDALGNLFAFSSGGVVYRVRVNSWQVERLKNVIFPGGVSWAGSFKKGVVWVVEGNRLKSFESNETGELIKERVILSGLDISWIIKTDNDCYLASTWTMGLYKLKVIDGELTSEKVDEYAYKNSNQIYSVKHGEYWISSDHGAILLQERFFSPVMPDVLNGYIQDVKPLNDSSILVSKDNIVVKVSARDNSRYEVVYRYPGGGSVLKLFPTKEGFWFSTNDGKIGFRDKNNRVNLKGTGSSGAIFNLFVTNDGDVWFCQDGAAALSVLKGGTELKRLGANEGVTSRIISIAGDASGKRLYLGGTTDDGYLFELDKKSGRFINLSKQLPFEHNVPVTVNDIDFFDGGLYMATLFGVLKYTDGKVTRVETGQFTSSTVKSLAVISENHFWMSASEGVVKYDNGEVFVFSERDGLPSKTSSFRAMRFDLAGNLWNGTISGLSVAIHPSQVEVLPAPSIACIILNGDTLLVNNFSHKVFVNHDFLKIRFTSDGYPGKSTFYRYRYTSAGDTSAWVEVGPSLDLYVDHLKKGDYQFEVQVKKNGNYKWSDSLFFPVKVRAVWYKMPMVWITVIILLVIFIALMNGWSVRRHRQRQSQLEDVISTRTAEIIDQKLYIEKQRDDIEKTAKELEQSNAELLKAKLEAERLVNVKSQFLSTMSHELRTPLNAVIGMTYILLGENPRPEQLPNLNTLKFSAENLLALINDILDYSKIEAGRLIFEDVDFDLREKMNNIAQVMRIKADEKGIRLILAVEQDMPSVVTGDSTRLNQILFNLIGNAVKFTLEGEVRVIVKRQSVLDRTLWVEFEVNDTGIGIADDKIDRIFEVFTQGDAEITRRFGGTGLGLTITKKLIELQGGSIEVESTLGIGTTFRFNLPFMVSATDVVAPAAQRVGEVARFNGESILIVDDNPINLLVAEKFLVKWNLRIDTAENGLEALEMITNNQYSIVLMDLQMPELDGYSATREIRRREAQMNLPHLPVIALTASALLEVQEAIREAGLDDFVTKPFNPLELNNKLKQFLVTEE